MANQTVVSLTTTKADVVDLNISKKFRKAIQATKNCRIEIIMKDNHTIDNNPNNVIRWCQVAQEEARSI